MISLLWANTWEEEKKRKRTSEKTFMPNQFIDLKSAGFHRKSIAVALLPEFIPKARGMIQKELLVKKNKKRAPLG